MSFAQTKMEAEFIDISPDFVYPVTKEILTI